MNRFLQKLKEGKVRAIDVPPPALPGAHVLVRAHFSASSAEEEASTARNIVGRRQNHPTGAAVQAAARGRGSPAAGANLLCRQTPSPGLQPAGLQLRQVATLFLSLWKKFVSP